MKPITDRARRRVNLFLASELHRQLRIRAAAEGTTLQALIEALLSMAADRTPGGDRVTT